ncbi:uncharacterized protein BCR38DRAFT_310932, partial [Pseudomassariella vexata]
ESILANVAGHAEFIQRIGSYLSPTELLNLYCASRHFNSMIENCMRSSFYRWSLLHAPKGMFVFDWRHWQYRHLIKEDKSFRSKVSPPLLGPLKGGEPKIHKRMIPTMKWFQMICFREEIVSDILATLARQGLRYPRGTSISVMKLWRLLDLRTTKERNLLIQDKNIFTDVDLWNMQHFLCKLALRFNDPVYGPESCDVVTLFMSQKSLLPLWELLFGHKYYSVHSFLQLKIRTDLGHKWHLPDGSDWQGPDKNLILGVPAREVGQLYLGTDGKKLVRPASLIATESARRQLHLEDHILNMFLWGFVDLRTGNNLGPTEQEIFMKDEDRKNRSIDTTNEFTKYHARNALWHALSRDEK